MNFFYTDDVVGRFIIDDFLTYRPNRRMTPQGIFRSYIFFLKNQRDIDNERARIMAKKDLEGIKFLTWHKITGVGIYKSLEYNFVLVTGYKNGKLLSIETAPYEIMMDENVIQNMADKYPDIVVCRLE